MATRRTAAIKEAEKIKASTYCDTGSDQPGFELLKISDQIGYGVVTKKAFKSGDFLLEYTGDRISKSDALRREKHYKNQGLGCYIFFDIEGIRKRFCIDATTNNQLCRYVNDSPEEYANAKMMRECINNKIYLVLRAKNDLPIGTELRYDYCVPESEMSWRKQETCWKPFELGQKGKAKNAEVKFQVNQRRVDDVTEIFDAADEYVGINNVESSESKVIKDSPNKSAVVTMDEIERQSDSKEGEQQSDEKCINGSAERKDIKIMDEIERQSDSKEGEQQSDERCTNGFAERKDNKIMDEIERQSDSKEGEQQSDEKCTNGSAERKDNKNIPSVFEHLKTFADDVIKNATNEDYIKNLTNKLGWEIEAEHLAQVAQSSINAEHLAQVAQSPVKSINEQDNDISIGKRKRTTFRLIHFRPKQ
ncbi:uncharacterized protein [Clytia hemisphaerica]|uniref:uncharacterized protein n=1 Tax=Clytia hemisphaerica TaxID=252671 RepID=UPI0034D49629